MSHVAKIDLVITDLECLAKACEACGLHLNLNQTHYKWFGRWVNDYNQENAAYKHGVKPEDYGKCSHAISVPGNKNAYEVGVVKNPNGDGWVLIWDFYSGGHGLQAHLGGPKDCNKLRNAYSKEVVVQMADELGFVYDWEEDEHGETTITLTDYS